MANKNHYLVISVDIEVDPADAAKFKELMQIHVENTHKEPGCMYFEVAEDNTAPGMFHIWEAYRDQAAIDEHGKNPSLATFREASAPLVKKRTRQDMTIFTS